MVTDRKASGKLLGKRLARGSRIGRTPLDVPGTLREAAPVNHPFESSHRGA